MDGVAEDREDAAGIPIDENEGVAVDSIFASPADGEPRIRLFKVNMFTRLFGDLLTFVYHCFDRIVIHGYLSGLSRPEQVVYFVRHVLGIPVGSKEALSQRTNDYRQWVEGLRAQSQDPEWSKYSNSPRIRNLR